MHNTPFGDIVDTEDDLQLLVLATFRDATRAVKLTAAAMGGARAELDADAVWLNGATDALKSAERRLAARSAAL